MAKLDLTVYVLGTARPSDPERLAEEYREGNDVAFYLLARQARRRGADPTSLWEGAYEPLVGEPLLERSADAVRTAALWNLLDPALAATTWAYLRRHVVAGDERVQMPRLRLGEGWGLTVGTRAALGPSEVSRFLDLHVAMPRGVLTVYLRDLDSSRARTWGGGVAVHALRLAPALELGLQADLWDEPAAAEGPHRRGLWHAAAQLDARGGRWGAALKLGAKEEGFFPGLPLRDGPYLGLGLTATW